MNVFVCGCYDTDERKIRRYRNLALAKFPCADISLEYLQTGDIKYFVVDGEAKSLISSDFALFFDKWHTDGKARIGHQIALEFGVPIEYINSKIHRRPVFRHDQVEEIVQQYKNGLSVEEIANNFRVTLPTIKAFFYGG